MSLNQTWGPRQHDSGEREVVQSGPHIPKMREQGFMLRDDSSLDLISKMRDRGLASKDDMSMSVGEVAQPVFLENLDSWKRVVDKKNVAVRRWKTAIRRVLFINRLQALHGERSKKVEKDGPGRRMAVPRDEDEPTSNVVAFDPLVDVYDLFEDHYTLYSCELQDMDVARESKLRLRWITLRGASIKQFMRLKRMYCLQQSDIEAAFTGRRACAVNIYDAGQAALSWTVFREVGEELLTEQAVVFVNNNVIISLLPDEAISEFIHTKLSTTRRKLQSGPVAYLLYLHLAASLQLLISITNKFSELVDDLEIDFSKEMHLKHYRQAQSLKRDLLLLRKRVKPLKDFVQSCRKLRFLAPAGSEGNIGESRLGSGSGKEAAKEAKGVKLFTKEAGTIQYLKETSNKLGFQLENIETLRELCVSMTDNYMVEQDRMMSSVSYVVALVSTVFIPNSFLAGVYGMNFEYFPELKVWWAYPMFWVVCVLISASLLITFRLKKWL
mmetsp:Transcript_27126/g.68133  ORF Transcript_27126/g.68133 Transcript_27126/m.68133 type:complete len:497 (-) Transcript_27126:96-1586(-)|eukprot:CAMPEP_0177666164 /NCGR_PEP_ID=MMETSP0447-20121125/21438_1 /TAXON_ID=0 /ORGANISM="Stygamoeba regulata, Strain BSH-02190019" /LENGTH=496 /DNA_ID=CAMNT_0019172299 /DNA_START=251 /DNA_END=1741 /DNA_ORIENTATION=+